jgi:hypothetical protein
MLLRECLGTQFNNYSVPDRSPDFLPLSPPEMFPIEIHSSGTFPFQDPLGSNTWRLFNLMLNHLRQNKISFVRFPGSSSQVLVATYGQTIIWWSIIVALLFRSCLTWLHTFSSQNCSSYQLAVGISHRALPRPIKVIPWRSSEYSAGRFYWITLESRLLRSRQHSKTASRKQSDPLNCHSPALHGTQLNKCSVNSFFIKYHFSHSRNHQSIN